MMNVLQSPLVKNATHFVSFSRPQDTPRHQKMRVICCKATNDFRNELCGNLGCKRTADKDQIKKAYRKMALRYHPDVCDPSMREESTRMFIELQKVYTSMLDTKEPKEWDLCLEARASRGMWESQLSELKRRAYVRKELKDGSWGSRMRAKQYE